MSIAAAIISAVGALAALVLFLFKNYQKTAAEKDLEIDAQIQKAKEEAEQSGKPV